MAEPNFFDQFDAAPGGPLVGPARQAPITAPKTTYRTLSSEEVVQRGLNPGRAYQESSEGKIDDLGELPEAVTSGSDPKADAAAKLRKVIDQIDYLYNDSSDNGGWFETGYLGSKLRDTGGTAAYDLGQQVQTVEANAAFDALQRMREASPTGGALGQITERELDLLKSSVANINPNQSQEEFIRALGVSKGVYLDMLRRLDSEAAAEIEGRGNPQTDAAGNITYDERARAATPAATPPPGGSAPPPAGPPGPGFGSQMLDATQSTLAGLAQGAAGVYDLPMQAAQGLQRGVNYAVGEGGGALMDMVGAPGAADWWRQGSQGVESDIASRPSLSGLIEQASPTPQGHEAARFASQLVGGAMVPIGPKAVPRVNAPAAAAQPTQSAAREVIDAGAQNNVRVMTSDVRPPRTFTGKVARATGERIPYAGTGGPRAAQQGERVEAVRELAREFGADASVDFLDQVADDLGKTRGGKLTALSRQKNTVIDSVPAPLAPTNVARTLEAIDAQVQRLSGIDAEEYAPVIDRLTRFGANIASGKSLRQVEENRKLLGAMFEDATLASLKSEGQKAINAIYAPLRDDMADFIGATAGPAAQGQWSRANRELAGMAGELSDNVFRGVLRDAETTPENVAKLLFSKKPSEVRRLVTNLSPAGRAKAQAAVIARAIEQSGGLEAVSPDRFANAVGKLGDSAGVVFEGADLARVQGIERLLQATKQAGVASAAPPTGAQNMPLLMGASVPMTGGVSAAVLGGVGGLARLYESAAVRNMLVGLGKAPKGSKAESQLLERILKVATSQTQIRGTAANDVLAASPSRVAASEQENN